jgi:hypothetical protein
MLAYLQMYQFKTTTYQRNLYMKTTAVLLLVIAFFLASPATAGDYTVKAPAGWTKNASSSAPEHYMKNGVSLILTIDSAPAEAKTIDGYVEYVKKMYVKQFKSVKFEPVKKLTIHGNDARELLYTADISGMKMKYDVVFIPRQTKVYTMTAGGLSDTFDPLKPECQTFFNSFKFK